jgi:hypothetical protein
MVTTFGVRYQIFHHPLEKYGMNWVWVTISFQACFQGGFSIWSISSQLICPKTILMVQFQ